MLSDANEKSSGHKTEKVNPMVITGREFNRRRSEQSNGLSSRAFSYVSDLLENT
jgi:hypothetical protein